MIHFPKPPQKEIRYFWGYRNFVLCDAWSELPIIEETRPANVVDSQVIIPQLRKLSDKFSFPIGAVISDSALDSAKVLSFIIRDLKAKPYISRNLKRKKDQNQVFLPHYPFKEVQERTSLLSLDASPVCQGYRLFCLPAGGR
ncbi:MAG TPA: hypothetical protein DEG96_03370 [Candidatus Atribacteria bacterium]|nr:hypothetical protein [Candidatus Atribacteria bacterium]